MLRHIYNERFFDEWSPDMAWVLGLLLADGNIRKDRRITLASKDIDMLEQVQWLIDTNAPIYQFKGRDLYNLQVCSNDPGLFMANRYGLVPNKSRRLQWPYPPDWCMSHFVRGLWDGDGTMFDRWRTRTDRGGHERTYHEITTEYCCGTEVFTINLRDAIFDFTGVDARVRQRQAQYKPYWVFTYYHRNSLIFLDWLYQESTSLTRLARKFEKYMDVLGEG